jgi:circadian clock protein KaiC
MTSLTGGDREKTEVAISSLVDTWLLLRNAERNGERHRDLFILKARGIGHSTQVREFVLTARGVVLSEPHAGREDAPRASPPREERWR